MRVQPGRTQLESVVFARFIDFRDVKLKLGHVVTARRKLVDGKCNAVAAKVPI
jgi:hypothetical protein